MRKSVFVIFVLNFLLYKTVYAYSFEQVISNLFNNKPKVAGSIEGSFHVNNNGAAIYEIEIKTPPGINKFQPELKLQYNSQKQNGILGKGWNLTGLSSISRCPQTFSQDGVKGGVNFDSNDRFCVDGARLIAVSGNYGADGAEYRTEKEQWVRYYSHGICGSGPCYFTAETKEGMLLEFGNTNDSRIIAEGKKEIRIWAINSKTDKNNNFLCVNYYQNSSDGEYYPIKIEYTGNTITKLAPQRFIQLDYEDRSDKSTSYAAGSKVQKNKRLKQISTYVDGNLVKRYILNYNISSITGFSILKTIEECDNSSSCLQPTNLTWQNNLSSNYKLEKQLWSNQGQFLDEKFIVAGDFNADGLGDVSYIYNNSGNITIKVYTSSGSSFANNVWANKGEWSNQSFAFSGDYNGDGLTDIVYAFNDSGKLSSNVYLSTGSFFKKINWGNFEEYWYESAKIQPGDFNGDGLTDIAYIYNDTGKYGISIYLSDGKSFYKSSSLSKSEGQWFNTGATSLGDFNGDGLTDIAYAYNDSGQVAVSTYISTGISLNKNVWKDSNLKWSNDSLLSFSDYNGDGLTDISYFFNENGNIGVKVLLCNGISFATKTWSTGNIFWQGPQIIKSGDYNGDGLTDVAYILKDSNEQVSINMYLSTGSSFNRYEVFKNKDTISNDIFIPGDYSGDGRADIVNIANINGNLGINVYVSADGISTTHSLLQQDLLTEITDGLKSSITLKYKPITDNSVYQKGSDKINYPSANINIPYYVVSDSTIKEPISGNVSINNYFYKNAKINLQGRGWLGFQEVLKKNVTDKDAKLNTVETKHYFQNFPLTGLQQDSILTRASDEIILEKQSVDYGFSKTYSNNSSNVYAIYKKSTKLDYYSNGNYNYTLSKNYTYEPQYRYITGIDVLDSDKQNNYYICYQFDQNQHNAWWKQFFPIAKKITKTKDACANTNFAAWNSSTDLRFYQYQYDIQMNNNSKKAWNDQSSQWIEEKLTFDSYGNINTLTDPAGNISKIVYDSVYHTFPVKRILPPVQEGEDPLIKQTIFEPKFGAAIRYIDMNGNAIKETPSDGIDGFGRIIKLSSIHPDKKDMLPVIINSFFTNNQGGFGIKKQKRESWNINDANTWYWQTKYFDGLKRLYKRDSKGPSDTQPITSLIFLNNRGLTQKKSLPYYGNENPQFINYSYDIKKRLVKTILPNNTLYNIDFNQQDERIITTSIPDPTYNSDEMKFVNKVTKLDNNNREIQTKAVNGGITKHTYDALGQVTAIQDPLGNITKYKYNSLGKVIKYESPESGVVSYDYYSNGLIKTIMDAKLQKQVFTYDALGRVIQADNYKNNGKLEKTTKYTYDSAKNGKGLLTSITTPDVKYTFSYNYLGKIKNEIVSLNIGNKKSDFPFEYNYDALKRIEKVKLPDSSIINYTYNSQNKLSQIKVQEAGESSPFTVASYQDYTAAGKYKKLILNNGITSLYDYDLLGRMISNTVVNSNSILRKFGFSWNRASKIYAINDLRTHPDLNLSQFATYDKNGFMKTSSDISGKVNYDYNLDGDIKTYNNISYAYDTQKKHQMVSACDKNSGECKPYLKLSYDEKGNTVSKELFSLETTWIYDYDVQGNLTSVYKKNSNSNPNLINTFNYGQTWKRLKKVNADGTSTYYISPYFIVNANQAGEISHIKHISGNGKIVASIEKDKNIHYIHTNHLGSTTFLTDEKGKETDKVIYKPYGMLDKKDSTIVTNFIPKFTGKEIDYDAELYYFGARYYDPQLVRFTSPDPAKQFASPYLYAKNDPLRNIDPDGRIVGIDDLIELAVTAVVAAEAAESVAAGAATGVAVGEATAAMAEVVQTEAEVTSVAAASSISASGASIDATQAAISSTLANESIATDSTLDSGINIAASEAEQSSSHEALSEETESLTRGKLRVNQSDLQKGREIENRRGVNKYYDIKPSEVSNRRVFASTTEVDDVGTNQVLEHIRTHYPGARTLVLSGSHGTGEGLVAAEDSTLGEFAFLEQDVFVVGPSTNIDVVDLTQYGEQEIDSAFAEGTLRGARYDCVIGAFCFSASRYNAAVGNDIRTIP